MTISASDFSSYSRQELIDLCREKQVSGHSKKKIHELIDLLVKAGVQAPKTAAPAQTLKPATETLQQPSQQLQQPQSHVQQRQYIFNTAWTNVLPYLEDATVSLVIADPASNALGDKWITEGLRLLTDDGTFLIRGIPRVPPCVPKTIHTTWYTLHDKTKILGLHKQPDASVVDAGTVSDLYGHCLQHLQANSTVLLPFAGDGETAKIVNAYPCTLVAMDRDEARIQTLYSLLTK